MTEWDLSALRQFPITGAAVCRFLGLFPAELVWNVRRIETLSDKSASQLGGIWHSLRYGGSLDLSTQEIREALGMADQIVNLQMSAEQIDADLSIDDGDLFSFTMRAARSDGDLHLTERARGSR